jgi:hypothetical protein
MYPEYACKEHVEALRDLEKAGIYSPEFIPQLEDVSTFLKRKSYFLDLLLFKKTFFIFHIFVVIKKKKRNRDSS